MNIQSFFPVARAQDASSTGSTGQGSSSSGTNNELDANSFITLLTAQLQAQDPLNPMDPKDMMNELVSLNTLQELIRIRQDLEGVSGTSTGTTGNGLRTGAVVPAQNHQSVPNASYHDAVIQNRIFPAQTPASN